MSDFLGNGVSGGLLYSPSNAAPTMNAGTATAAPSSAFGYGSMATAIISAIGNYQLAKTQAKSMKSSLEFQSDMARVNARMAEQTAQSVLLSGQRSASNLGMRAGKLKSSQRVALAANGVSLDEGNAVEVQATTDLMKEMDMNTIEANAIRSAWGYRTQGVNYANQATLTGASADSISPQQAGNSSLISGASNVAQRWYGFKQAGVI